MKHSIWIVLIAAVCGAFFLAKSAGQEPKSTTREFMRAKLVHSQTLLEALATEDLPKLAKNAQDISLLTLAESWQVLQTAEYAQHSLEFRRTANALNDAAKKKNIDGAALAYVDMTMKCVNCHKYVRDARLAGLNPPLDSGLAGIGK